MNRPLTTVRILIALFVGLAVSVTVAAGPASAATQSSRYLKTQEGLYLAVIQKNIKVRSVPPLDSSPTSREAFLGADTSATIKGPKGSVIQQATFETGYEIGYPVSFAPSGVSITLNTPSLSITPGISAGVDVLGPVVKPNAGVTLGATADVLPSQSFAFTVAHGGITEIPLAKVGMSQPAAYADLGGTHITATGAMGPVTVRPYTRMTVLTAAGSSTVVTYGPTQQI